MLGLLSLAVIATVFAALGLAAMRWGVDTREWSFSLRSTPSGRN
jgi:hypothetical protein